MPDLILTDVPAEIIDQLEQMPEEERRELLDFMRQRLRERLTRPRLPLPPVSDEAISAPFDLPRPGPGERVAVRDRTERIPDPITDPVG